jgi:hypothetical protein
MNTKSRRRSTRKEDARHRRGTLQVRTWESWQKNTWTNEYGTEFEENSDKRTTDLTRNDIPQLVCFSPSSIYSLLLQTMSTVSTPTVSHTAPSPPPPSPLVLSAPDNTPEPMSPHLACCSQPIREDEEEESAVSDDRADEQLMELTTPVGYIPNTPHSKHFYPIYVTTKKYWEEGTGLRIVIAPFIKYNPDYTYIFRTEGEGCEIRNIPVQVGRRAQHYEWMTGAKWWDLREGDI